MRTGDAAEPRPQPDGRGAVVLSEAGLDQRERSGGEQRAADALQHPGEDEDQQVGRQAAQRGRQHEPHGADPEDAPAAEPVPQRTTEEDERGERQQVAREHPLEAGDLDIEVVGDVGQGDVHDAGIELGHRARGNRREEGDPTHRGMQCQTLVGQGARSIGQVGHRPSVVALSPGTASAPRAGSNRDGRPGSRSSPAAARPGCS